MEPASIDPSALTFREKKTLFSVISGADYASPQVGRINNPFSAPSAIRLDSPLYQLLEHHYPKLLTGSAPDQVRLAPAKLFGETPTAGSAAAFRRLDRKLSHKLILENATQADKLSPAPSATAAQLPSPPQSPDAVAMLWLPAAASGGPQADAPGANSHGAADVYGEEHGGSGEDMSICCGPAPTQRHRQQHPQQPLHAVADLLSQFVKGCEEKGLPVDPRVTEALRAARTSREEAPAVRLAQVAAVKSDPGSHRGSAGDEAGGEAGAAQVDASCCNSPPLSPPRLLRDASGVPAEWYGAAGAGGDGDRSCDARADSKEDDEQEEGKAAGECVAGTAAPIRNSSDGGGMLNGSHTDEEAPAQQAPELSCVQGEEKAEEERSTLVEESYNRLHEQARQLREQLQQRALAQYDTNRASAAAVRRSLHRLQAAAAAAAVAPAPPAPPVSRPTTGPVPRGVGFRRGPAQTRGSAAAIVPMSTGTDADLAAALQEEQRRREELAAQCARLQRQCDGLLSYISMLSGNGCASLAAAAAGAFSSPAAAEAIAVPSSPLLGYPLLARGEADHHHQLQSGAGAPAGPRGFQLVRVRLVVLPLEGAVSASAGAANTSEKKEEEEEVLEERQEEEQQQEEEQEEEKVCAGAGQEPPVRVKLQISVRRSCLVLPQAQCKLALLAPSLQQQQQPPAAEALLPGVAAAAGAPLQQQQQQQQQQLSHGGRDLRQREQRCPERGNEAGGLTAAVRQLLAAVEEQAAAAAASAAGAATATGTAAALTSSRSGAAVAVPPVPQSVLDGLRGVLRQLREGDEGCAADTQPELQAAPSHDRSARRWAPKASQPLGKPPRPPTSGLSLPVCDDTGPVEAALMWSADGLSAASGAALTSTGGIVPDRETAVADDAASVASQEDDEGANGGGGGGCVTRRSYGAPAFPVDEDDNDDDYDESEERYDTDEDRPAGAVGVSPFAGGVQYGDGGDAAAGGGCANASGRLLHGGAAAGPRGLTERVPTPPCSPRSFACSPTFSNDLDLELELAATHSHLGSSSVAAAGACSASASSGGCCEDGYGCEYGGWYGCEDLDHLDLADAEWDELAMAAAAHGPGALLSAVGFLREQLQLAHLEIVSLTTQLGALSHQREGIRARATENDAALQLLAINELLEAQRLRAQLASERAARARLSAQCEDLQNRLLSGLPDRPFSCSLQHLSSLHHYNPHSHTPHPFGSPTKSSLGGAPPGSHGQHQHQHTQHHHHSGSLQRLSHGHPHASQHYHQQQLQVLEGTHAQQLQQLLLQHQKQQQQLQHHQLHQRVTVLQRHRSAPRYRPSSGVMSARAAEEKGVPLAAVGVGGQLPGTAGFASGR